MLIVFSSVVALFFCLAPAVAQPADMPRIGFMSPASSAGLASRVEAFRTGLREFGYADGRNVTIEYRWADGKGERLSEFALEFVHLKVAMIVSHGVEATLAARKASSTVPIVCFACGDVISTGLVASLSRPGGNITGLTIIAPEVSGKRLELLKQIVPGLTRVAAVWNSSNPVSGPEVRETEVAARALGLQLESWPVKGPDGLPAAFAAIQEKRAGAVIVLSDAALFSQRRQISELASASRLPAISFSGEFAEAGVLMSYGPDLKAIALRAASFVDRILKGAKPAELPVEQPTKFELVINLRTAKALGVAIPQAVLLRADRVIE